MIRTLAHLSLRVLALEFYTYSSSKDYISPRATPRGCDAVALKKKMPASPRLGTHLGEHVRARIIISIDDAKRCCCCCPWTMSSIGLLVGLRSTTS